MTMQAPSHNAKMIKFGAIYGRVSVEDSAQVEHGSLEQQKHMGMELAGNLSKVSGIEHKVKYFLIEERGVSGGTTNRPKYKQLLDLIKSGEIDFLIAKEVTRLSRSLKDFIELMELCKLHGVAVHIRGLDVAPNSPTGELFYKLIAMIGEFERRIIVQRTTDTIRSAMINNAKIGGGPPILGFNLDPNHKGRWLKNVEELKLVHFLFQTFIGNGSLAVTVGEANRLGFKNKTGTAFTTTAVRRLLENPKYLGKMVVTHGENNELKSIVDLPYGEAVPKAIFDEAQMKLAKLKERKGMNRSGKRTFLLTGLLKFEDGTDFCGSSGTGRKNNEKKISYYYINKANKFTVDALEIEGAIIKALRDAYENNEDLNHYLNQMRTQETSRLDLLDEQIRQKRRALIELENEESVLKQKFLAIEVDKMDEAFKGWMQSEVKKHNASRDELENSLTELEQERDTLLSYPANPEKFKRHLSDIFSRVFKLEPTTQKEFFREVFSKIEVFRNNQIKLTWKIPGSCDGGGSGSTPGSKRVDDGI